MIPQILKKARLIVLVVTPNDFFVVDRKTFDSRVGNLAVQFEYERRDTAVRRVMRRVAKRDVPHEEVEVLRVHTIGQQTYAVCWFAPTDWSIEKNQHLVGLVMASRHAAEVDSRHAETLAELVEKARSNRAAQERLTSRFKRQRNL